MSIEKKGQLSQLILETALISQVKEIDWLKNNTLKGQDGFTLHTHTHTKLVRINV